MAAGGLCSIVGLYGHVMPWQSSVRVDWGEIHKIGDSNDCKAFFVLFNMSLRETADSKRKETPSLKEPYHVFSLGYY